jgi:hypothetical protein
VVKVRVGEANIKQHAKESVPTQDFCLAWKMNFWLTGMKLKFFVFFNQNDFTKRLEEETLWFITLS